MEFVTGHAGTDHISAADMASLYRGLLIEDDVVLATGSQLECTMIDANTAEIGTGDCMLQAHHARVDVAEQLEVRSGSNGYNRNDLIVARYSLGTGNIQSVYLAVIEGTAVAGDAEDPAYVTGDIDSGATLVEFPLWRIPITGVNVGTPERIMPTVDTLQSQITGVRESVAKETITTGIFSPASGVSVESETLYVFGKVAHLELVLKHASAWSNGVQLNIGTVNQGYRPKVNIGAVMNTSGLCLLLSTGAVYVRPMSNNYSAGDTENLRFTYLLP